MPTEPSWPPGERGVPDDKLARLRPLKLRPPIMPLPMRLRGEVEASCTTRLAACRLTIDDKQWCSAIDTALLDAEFCCSLTNSAAAQLC